MRNSDKHENSKDKKATLGILDIFGQRNKRGNGVLDLRNENG